MSKQKVRASKKKISQKNKKVSSFSSSKKKISRKRSSTKVNSNNAWILQVLQGLLWIGSAFFLFEFFLHLFGLPVLEHDTIFIWTHDRYIAILALTYSVLLAIVSTNFARFGYDAVNKNHCPPKTLLEVILESESESLGITIGQGRISNVSLEKYTKIFGN